MDNMFDIHRVPLHAGAPDLERFIIIGPNFIKTVWDGEPGYAEDAIAAGARYIYRDYLLSENWGDRNLVGPVRAAEIGREHAAYLAPIYQEWIARGGDPERIYFEGLNEPHVWTWEERPELVAIYYREFTIGVHAFGGRAIVGNFGVGWPGTKQAQAMASAMPRADFRIPPRELKVEDAAEVRMERWRMSTAAQQANLTITRMGDEVEQPVDWAFFHPVFDVMITTGAYTDYLGTHEYWWLNGHTENWGWWGGRILQLDRNVPVLITECGIDGGVVGQWNKGWGSLPGNEQQRAITYNDDLWGYMRALREDQRIQGIFVFTWDGNRDEWGEFNIRTDAYYEQLIIQSQQEGWITPKAYDPYAPVPPNPIVPPDPPPPGERAEGITVSIHQSDGKSSGIDWPATEALGYSFTFIKTSENTWTDPALFFHHNRCTEDTDMLRASFHFLRQDHDRRQGRLAALLWGSPDLGFEIPLAIDVEDFTLKPGTVRNAMERAYEKSGGRILAYASQYTWMNIVGPGATWAPLIADLWAADAGGRSEPLLPDVWDTWEFWHYGQTKVPGWPERVDVNYFNGTEAEMRAKYGGGPIPPPPPVPPYTMNVRYEPGLNLILGCYPVVGVPVILTKPDGTTDSTVTGSKPDECPGGFEFYAWETGSHKLTVGGWDYWLDMAAGHSALCEWVPV